MNGSSFAKLRRNSFDPSNPAAFHWRTAFSSCANGSQVGCRRLVVRGVAAVPDPWPLLVREGDVLFVPRVDGHVELAVSGLTRADGLVDEPQRLLALVARQRVLKVDDVVGVDDVGALALR